MPAHAVTKTTQHLAELLLQRHWMLATAESCTAGMIASTCTDLAGSSAWFDCGFVTYSNDAKTRMLGVPDALIRNHGAVSEAVVQAMAQAAVMQSCAQVSIAVSGVAGPGGGTPDKPVGTVWMAWQVCDTTHTECVYWKGDRHQVRSQTTRYVLERLCGLILAYPQDSAPLTAGHSPSHSS